MEPWFKEALGRSLQPSSKMPKITFYPLGNADTTLITLDQKLLLFDFAAMRDPDDKHDRRIDLPPAVREDIGWSERKEIDVVAFTHLDDDHVRGASEFFHLEHAIKYQIGDRVKIRELWVPAAAITDENSEDDARVIRQEARHRLREGKGIRVFSRPAQLKAWFDKQEGITLESRRHLITDAGQLVPGWSKESDGLEFFVHSPFGERDGDVVLDRNQNSLVFQAVFKTGETRFLLSADTTWENWDRIVQITRLKKNEDRLEWDIFKLPHHCSYLSLSSEKGKTETTPVPNVQSLLDKGALRSIVVSTSWPIEEDDQTQPPHVQAKRCYKRVLSKTSGTFLTTMEEPTRIAPKRLVIQVTQGGARHDAAAGVGSGAVVSTVAPRVG